MKKILLILCVIPFGLVCLGCVHTDKKYEYKRWEKGFTRFFSEEMKQKTPNLVEHENYEIYQRKNPFKILKDEKTLLYGVYDNTSEIMSIPYKYNNLKQCGFLSQSMYFQTKEDNKFKVIDYKDNVIFESEYDDINCSNWFGILTSNKGKYGIVSFEGKELEPIYDEIEGQEHFGESGGFYYIVKKDNKYGVFDNHANEIIPLQKKPLYRLGTGPFFLFKKGNKYGVIDIYQRIIVKPQYNKIEFNGELNKNAYFKACNKKICSILDLKGNTKLKNINSEEIIQLAEGYYAVGLSQRKMDIINNKGKIQNKQSFQMIRPYNEEYALIIRFGENYGQGLIDFQGNIIMEPINVDFILNKTPNNIFKVEKASKYGLVYNSKLIVPIEFDKIYFYKEHILIRFYKNDKAYYYVGSYKDFEGENFKLSDLKFYRGNTIKDTNENCFKFTDAKGSDTEYCKN